MDEPGRLIRVLIADDHAMVREGVRALLSIREDIEVVGEASDGREAIELALQLNPDVVLMDIAMPGLGGLEATLELRQKMPTLKVVVLSQYDDREYIARFLKAGVSGYVLKKAGGEELVSAVRAAVRGESFLTPSVATQVIEQYLDGPKGDKDSYELLSPREKQVLKLIAEGFTLKDIAAELAISVKTVVAHQSHISEKLGIHSRAKLIRFAVEKGIVRPEL